MRQRSMKRVLVIVPYHPGVEEELKYAYSAFSQSLEQGEVPFVPVLHYTDGGLGGRTSEPVGGLDPNRVSLDWISSVDEVVFYTNLGWTHAMEKVLQTTRDMGKEYTIRVLRPCSAWRRARREVDEQQDRE